MTYDNAQNADVWKNGRLPNSRAIIMWRISSVMEEEELKCKALVATYIN